MSESVLQVFLFRDGAYVGSEVFSENELVVGSGDEADLVVNDDFVGDAHAIIAREGQKVRVLDLGHAGGTKVNGELTKHSFVTARDEISVGMHTLKLKLVRKGAQKRQSLTPPTGTPVPSHPSAPPAISDLQLPEPQDAAPQLPLPAQLTSTDIIRERLSSPIDEPLSQPPVRSFGTLDEALEEVFASPVTSEPNSADEPLGASDLQPQAPIGNNSAVEPATVAVDLGGLNRAREVSRFEFAASFEGEETDATPAYRAEVEAPKSLRIDSPPPPSPYYPPTTRTRVRNFEPPPMPVDEGDARVSSSSLPRVRAEANPIPKPITSSPEQAFESAFSEPPQKPSSSSTFEAPTQPYSDRSDSSSIPYYEEEIDPEELDANEPPGFSLLHALVQDGQARGTEPTLEVIHSEGGVVRSTDLLNENRKKLKTSIPGNDRFLLATVIDAQRAEIRFPTHTDGERAEEQETSSLAELKKNGNANLQADGVYTTRLREGQALTLRIDNSAYHFRFVRPPDIPPDEHKEKPELTGPIPRALGSSVVAHLVIALVIGLLSPAVSFSESPREIWAEVEPEKVREIEVPPPEPEPEPPPEPEPKPKPRPKPKKKTKRKPPPSVKNRRNRTAPKGKPKREVKKAGVLGALSKLGQTAPGRKGLVAAVTNIDAVKAPGSSDFRNAGLVSKAPSSKVTFGSGGGRLTRGTAQLLRGSGFARIGKNSGARVRGRVKRAVARSVVARGSISRAEIAKVINENFGQVQSCYERALIANPSLSGKLSLEWTINTDGRVSSTRQKFSTLKDAKVASCIMSRLKTWRFPKPRGGIVIVSYPFNFTATSY